MYLYVDIHKLPIADNEDGEPLVFVPELDRHVSFEELDYDATKKLWTMSLVEILLDIREETRRKLARLPGLAHVFAPHLHANVEMVDLIRAAKSRRPTHTWLSSGYVYVRWDDEEGFLSVCLSSPL